MTQLEQIEYRLDYLLSQYEQRKHEPGYRIQVVVLVAERRALLKKQEKPLADVE